MLPLWRDKVRIVLCKDRVIFLQLQGGARNRVVSKAIFPYAGAETGWQPVLALLQRKLQGEDGKKADVTVILSNYFVRFLVLPWNEATLSDAEQMALVQHRFAGVYGESREHWEYRLSEGAFGAPSLASAVPQELLSQLRTIIKASSLRLSSVQPYLMTAFNVCRSELGNEDGWFVLAERDTFCVGLLQAGQWSSIRLRRVSVDWFEEAMLLLEREALLMANGNQLNKVYVYSPESAVSAPENRGAWLIKRLQLNPLSEFSHTEMASYAMAAGL